MGPRRQSYAANLRNMVRKELWICLETRVILPKEPPAWAKRL